MTPVVLFPLLKFHIHESKTPNSKDLFATGSSKLVESYSKPTIANFGRSLFGGYCPTYVPDFVLHGMPSDDKLRQSLMAELTHAVQVKGMRFNASKWCRI